MKTLPANLVAAKNALASTDPWILLLEVTIPSDPEDVVRIARNTEDVVFGGHTYTAFPFSIDAVEESSGGELPSLSIQISNINQMIQAYLEEYDGLVGEKISLIVVNANHLSEDHSELVIDFEITGCQADALWATFSVGAPNPLARRYPLYRYTAPHCNWTGHFKGAECKYAGSDTTCKGTYEDCKSKGNTANFGGYLGLSRGGVKVV